MNPSLKLVLIVGFLIVILWNLGAGLYYMLTDKGQSKRTVNALTRRIAFLGGDDSAGDPCHLHGLDHPARCGRLTAPPCFTLRWSASLTTRKRR